MARLAPRESHAARACRQGRKRSQAWKQKYHDGSFSRCSRAQRMGRRTRKSVAALAGRPPACDPARPRSAGAGFGSKGRRLAAWNRAWAQGLPDMGCGKSAAAGALVGVGGDIAAGTASRPQVAVSQHESGRTAFPCRLWRICARDRWRRDGSPHGTATMLRDMSVERRRLADVGL